jgi:hypothetical protein
VNVRERATVVTRALEGIDAEGRPVYGEVAETSVRCRVGRLRVESPDDARRSDELAVLVPARTPVVATDVLDVESTVPELAGRWEVVEVVPLPTHVRLVVRR